jgi:hypothetical protein
MFFTALPLELAPHVVGDVGIEPTTRGFSVHKHIFKFAVSVFIFYIYYIIFFLKNQILEKESLY